MNIKHFLSASEQYLYVYFIISKKNVPDFPVNLSSLIIIVRKYIIN